LEVKAAALTKYLSSLNPNNDDSPFSASYIKANGIEAAQWEGNRLLQRMQVGTIAPYITQEARVKLDRIRRTTVTEPVEVEVSPAYMTYQQMPVKCETGDCVSFCQVEATYETVTKRVVSREAYTRYDLVPAEYKTITRRVRTGLAGTEYIVL
jgi:hypothetical protein